MHNDRMKRLWQAIKEVEQDKQKATSETCTPVHFEQIRDLVTSHGGVVKCPVTGNKVYFDSTLANAVLLIYDNVCIASKRKLAKLSLTKLKVVCTIAAKQGE